MILCYFCLAGAVNGAVYGQTLDIYQIKVSVGHATLVVYKNAQGTVEKSVLIDVGDDVADAQLIREVIHQHAQNKLDRVYITHGDKDHWGGLGTKGKYEFGLIQKLKESPFPTTIGTSSGSDPIGLKYTGALKRDDGVNIIYPVSLTGGLGNRNMNGSPQGLRQNLNNANASPAWEVLDWAYNDANYLLAGAGGPSLITLAADCKLNNWTAGDNNKVMNGCDAARELGKNNRSGVLLVKWGDFTFLIQGDLQASSQGAAHRIAASVSAYNPNTPSGANTRFPQYWNSLNASQQNAATISKRTYDDLVTAGTITNGTPSTSGIVRGKIKKVVTTGKSGYVPDRAGMKRKREDSENAPVVTAFITHATTVDHLNTGTFLAWPDRGRWELGRLINSYNGGRGDGKVSVGLVPHHGALTANLWFRTRHAIFGTPAHVSASHPHPEFYCVRAVHNTVGATNMYFTYLTDDQPSDTQKTYSRLNYLSEMNFTPSVASAILNSTGDYFRVSVTNGGSRFDISKAKKDGSSVSNLTGILITSQQY